MVPPKDKNKFNKLFTEYKDLLDKAFNAGKPKLLPLCIDNSPLKKGCVDGKAKLIFPQDLSLEEVNLEIPPRLNEIKNFYKDVPCTDAKNWDATFILHANCSMEAIAVHRTIKTVEILTKINMYNRIIKRKRSLEKADCSKTTYQTKPVQCVDGKPIIEVN